MLKLRDGIVELFRKAATSISRDVESALIETYGGEEDPSAQNALSVILDNIKSARQTLRPICQDTGMPVFYVSLPKGMSMSHIEETLIEATRLATVKVPLRPNAVDTVTEMNSGDNTGTGVPLIYFRESADSTLTVDLLLKGAGSENIGQTYKLPLEELSAERNFDGIRRCVLDAVHKAQGKGCPPYTIGVGIGGAKDQVARISKEQLLRKLSDHSPIEAVAELEARILSEINSLGIGPMGLGGKTTALGVKIGMAHRHPASYIVDVSFSCWANRRGRLVW